MNEETFAKLIIATVSVASTLLGTMLGGFITWRITRTTQELQKQLAMGNLKAQERTAIDAMLIKMLEFLIAYPYLENTANCHAYPNIGNANLRNGENAKERYEAYCIYVFNFLMRAFKHFDCDSKLLGDYIGLDEIVGLHYKWWFQDQHNYGYDEPFRKCIQDVYDNMRKAGKIS
jgi:hypothetical protein